MTEPRSAETILVVDDEPMVRKLVGEMLGVLGYKVLEARDGHDALRVVDTHAEHIHLLLTDMIMPKMNGQELAEQISHVRPRTRVLIMSGYSDDATMQQMVGKGAGFLAKPFSPGSLREAIRQALAAPPDLGARS